MGGWGVELKDGSVNVYPSPDVEALYERLVEAGKPKMCALGAAMRKLVHICYGVYKNQQPYQPQASLT